MKERAMKPKQPLKRKKTAKIVKTSTPQPNSAAEAAIFIGSLGIMLYAADMFLLGLVNSNGDTSRDNTAGLGFMLFVFGINLAAQSVWAAKENRRVDRYRQRIIAVYVTALPLLMSIVFRVLGFCYLVYGCKRSEVMNTLCVIVYNVLMTVKHSYGIAAWISAAGSMYLWYLLTCKDKLVWIYDKSRKSSEVNKGVAERAKKYRKIGLTLLAILPIMLVGKIITVVIVSSLALYASDIVWFILIPFDYFFTSMIWVLFVIAGLIFFVKSK
jgi:membrane protein